MVGIYRDGEVDRRHPLKATLADLTRGGRYRRLLLGGLAPGDVADFIAQVAEGAPSPELAAAVHQQTEGNPFYVTEVVRLLASRGALDSPEAGDAMLRGALPEDVKTVVAERLGRLSDSCRTVLEVAAVVGRDFELRVLEAATGLDPERLLAVLEEAEVAREIIAVPGGLGRWRFAHALVREVVYEGLHAGRLIWLHGQVGEALEAVHSADLGPRLAELAHHFVAAAPGGNVARAVRAATLAGRRALEMLAWEEAAELFERGLAAWSWPIGPTGSSIASFSCPSVKPGWPPATCLPRAPPISGPANWPGGWGRPPPWPGRDWVWDWWSPAGWSTLWRLRSSRRRWAPSVPPTVHSAPGCWRGWPGR
jgi:predicted ATPase